MTVLIAIFSLNTAMLTWAVLRKLARDHREQASSERRSHLRAVLIRSADSGDDSELTRVFASAIGRTQVQDDIYAVLAGSLHVHDDRARRIGDAARRSGLLAALTRQLTSAQAPERGRAVRLLGVVGGPLASAVVSAHIADPDPDVRLVAAASLGQRADHAAAQVLLDALAGDRLAPERLVEQLGAPWAVPALLDRLDDAKLASRHRAAIATALRLAADQRAEPALVTLALLGDFEEQVAAVKALATCGGPASEGAVTTALRAHGWELRAQAAATAGVLGIDTAVPHLELALADEAWWVRARAAEALARLGSDGIAALERAAAGNDRYAAERAAETLGRHQRLAA